MSTFSQNQVRNLIVGNSYGNQATVNAFKVAAVANSIDVFNGTGLKTYDGKLAFKVYNDRGIVQSSDLIDATKITYIKIYTYKPSTTASAVVSSITAENNTYYSLKLVFTKWGSLSAEDQYFVTASYTSDGTALVTEIIDGLVTEMYKNLSNEQPSNGLKESVTLNAGATLLPSNPYFTISCDATTITFTEKTQEYVTGKKGANPLEWDLIASFDTATAPVVTKTTRVKAIGGGKDVKEFEWFCHGNVGDYYRGMAYPNNFEYNYVASESSTYDIIEIGYQYTGAGVNNYPSDKQLTIALLAGQDIDGLIVDINTLAAKSLIYESAGPGTINVAAVVGGSNDLALGTMTNYAGATVTSSVAWITDQKINSGTGAVTCDTAVNATGAQRIGYVTVVHSTGSWTFKITQAAA